MKSFISKFAVFVMGVAIIAIIASIPYFNKINLIKNKVEIKINSQFIIADVVKDDATRARGLGGRDSIGINEGMLFLFDNEDMLGFWMKNMKFPIDIVWIGSDDAVVGITEDIDPQIGAKESELKMYYPPIPVKKVLEIKAGRARILRAQVGDVVRVRPLISISETQGTIFGFFKDFAQFVTGAFNK